MSVEDLFVIGVSLVGDIIVGVGGLGSKYWYSIVM